MKRNTLVQGTNDRATLSKNSMVNNGYFQDDFVKYFAANNTRRAPIINRGYFIRAFGVDHVVRRFLASKQSGAVKKQVLSLGAGFDSSFFRLHYDGLLEETVYYEVDFPRVVENKAKMIQQQEILLDAIGEVKSLDHTKESTIQTERYKLLGCDLKDIPQLEQSLLHCGIDCLCPTLLISEVVLTYLDPKSSTAVITWAAQFFSSALFLMFEQVYPADSFGIVMTNHFKNCGAPILGIAAYPTPEGHKDRFRQQGWPAVSCLDMSQIYYGTVPQEEKLRIGTLEPFDEFEEWHLMCSHYIVLTAFKGNCVAVQRDLYPGMDNAVANRVSCGLSNLRGCLDFDQIGISPSSIKLQRFGHSATVSPDGNILVIGGFGQSKGKHMRLEDVQLLTSNSGEWRCTEVIPISKSQLGPRMYHSTTALDNGSFFVFGGRTSPLKLCSSCHLLKIDKTQVRNSSSGISSTGESTKASQTREQTEEDGTYSADSYRYSCDVLSCNTNDPASRWRHTATRITVSPGDREQVLIHGGRSPSVPAFGDCFVFDVSSKTWSKVHFCGENIEPRHSHSACAWNHNVVLAGGLGQNMEPLSSVQVIDTRTRPMRVQTLDVQPPLEPSQWPDYQTVGDRSLHFQSPLSRSQILVLDVINKGYSHTAHVLQDTLILIGGVNPTSPHPPGVVLINLNSLAWVSYSLPHKTRKRRRIDPIGNMDAPSNGLLTLVCDLTSSPVMLHNHCSCRVGAQRIMVVGGGGNCFSFGTHLNGTVVSINVNQTNWLEC